MKGFITWLAAIVLTGVAAVGQEPIKVVLSAAGTNGVTTSTTTDQRFDGYIKHISLSFSGISGPTADVQVVALSNISATEKTLLDVSGTTGGEYPVRQSVVNYTNTTIEGTAACFPLYRQQIKLTAGNVNQPTNDVTATLYIFIDRNE